LLAGGGEDDANLPDADAFVDAVLGFAVVATLKGSGFNGNAE